MCATGSRGQRLPAVLRPESGAEAENIDELSAHVVFRRVARCHELRPRHQEYRVRREAGHANNDESDSDTDGHPARRRDDAIFKLVQYPVSKVICTYLSVARLTLICLLRLIMIETIADYGELDSIAVIEFFLSV